MDGERALTLLSLCIFITQCGLVNSPLLQVTYQCNAVRLYSNIKQLRRNGVRLKRDADIGPGVFGVVQLCESGGYFRLVAMEWGNSSPDNRLLPDVWDVRCHNFQGKLMRWIGFQREHENAPTYFQEWLVPFISEYPPREAIAGQRPLTSGNL